MKKLIFFTSVFCIATVSYSFAQSKVEKYCKVTVGVNPKGLSTKRMASISFGEIKKLFDLKDTSTFEKLKVVNRFNNETDVLNYMSTLGWSLAQINVEGNYIEVLYFKKLFDTSELVPTDNLKCSNTNSD